MRHPQMMKQSNPTRLSGPFIRPVYLEPLTLSINAVSKKLGVHFATFGRLVSGKAMSQPKWPSNSKQSSGAVPKAGC